MHDRAPQVNVSDDRLSVTGHKFYCLIRANHFVNNGSWFFEVKIQDLPEGAATRIGWAQKNANLQAPLGFDKFGYSCRSRKGTKFHESIGKHYSDGYKVGDILGCMIILPSGNLDFLPKSYKVSTVVFRFKQCIFLEQISCLNRKSCLNQTLFNLFFHFGKSEILLKSKILPKSNVLKSKNYCNKNQK